MPQSWLQDEDKWTKAKQVAEQEGRSNDFAYITGIYKKAGGRIAKTKKNLKKALILSKGKIKEIWFI